MIYIPGTGILASYTDPMTQSLNEQFAQALAMYIWAWLILTVIFTIAAMRSSWILFLDLVALDIDLLLLACGYMLGNKNLLTAGNSFGFLVAFLSCKCSVQIVLRLIKLRLFRLGWQRRIVGWGSYSNQITHIRPVQREAVKTPML